MDGKWLTITEYSEYREISISTVRRYIKANTVTFKKEGGKYLIHVSDQNFILRENLREKEELSLKLEVLELKGQLKSLEEENNDLKMLVSLYENNSDSRKNLPSLPSAHS